MQTTNPTTIDEVLDDVTDTRSIVDLVNYLESVRDDEDEEEEDREEASEELTRIAEFVSELQGLTDYEYGETLIRDDAFEDYARQLAEDIGAISDDVQWPMTYIDWTAAAEALQQDYSAFEFEGVTYWGRS